MKRGSSNFKHGFNGRYRLYRIWCHMRNRCNCSISENYNRYGARGIKICDEWDNFLAFHSWAMQNGYSDNLTIDRINNDKGYCPENCRWITQSENSKNRKSRRIGDWGIHKSRSYYTVQITMDRICYYGGCSQDINKVRLMRDKLALELKNK